MISEEKNIYDMKLRIRELEDKVEALRISRRVLMNLIEVLEREKKEQLNRLITQNEKLQRTNCYYARALMIQNQRISELEQGVTSKAKTIS